MFTGIVTHIGKIGSIDKKGDWTFSILAPDFVEALSVGASVACSGVCLTVVRRDPESFDVQASAETLSKTTLGSWNSGGRVNLERALRMGDELGGHMVSGHVDGVAHVVSRVAEGESLRFVFEAPAAFAPFLASKGSVALDGVSLTVNEIEGARFGVNIIPHTQGATTMGQRQAGDALNLEVDTIARYVRRMLGA